jgi:anti-sigma B factor antagonist
MAASPRFHTPHEAGAAAGARVTLTFVGRRTVLAVSGDVDLDTATLVADAIEDALDGGALELWLDFSATRFMDSTGLHLLLETQDRVRAHSRRLAVVCPAGPVRRLLELAGLAHELPLFEDRAAANRGA